MIKNIQPQRTRKAQRTARSFEVTSYIFSTAFRQAQCNAPGALREADLEKPRA